MNSKSLRFVRSASLSEARLRDLIDALSLRRPDDGKWNRCTLDGREGYFDDPDMILLYHPIRLTTLEHFRLARGKNDNVWEVNLSLSGFYLQSEWTRWSLFFESLTTSAVRYGHLTCDCLENRFPPDPARRDFCVSAVKRFNAGSSVVFGAWAPNVPLERRLQFASGALASLGLIDRVVVENGKLKLSGDLPWHVGVGEVSDGIATLELREIGSLPDAIVIAERILRSPLVNVARTYMSMTCALVPPAYEAMLDELNRLSNQWSITLYGSYADGIDPYTADASQSPDGRFPIVSWSNRDGSHVYFQADIIPTPSGRYLEIHSNCGSMQELLDEAEAATGVRFTPVDEPGNTEN